MERFGGSSWVLLALALWMASEVRLTEARINPKNKPLSENPLLVFKAAPAQRPEKGRALMPGVDGRLSRKVVAGSDTETVTGGPLALWIKVTDASDTVKSCTWRSPDGVDYPTDPTAKGSSNANGDSPDAKRCRFNVTSLTADQLGTWRCKVFFTDIDTYRVAFFTATAAIRVSDIRLPRHLVPEHYVVFLTPFLIVNNFTIQGHVDIKMNAVAPGGTNITLHVQDMTIFENSVAVVDPVGETSLEVEGFGYDGQRKFFIVYLVHALAEGQTVSVSIDFLGNLNDDLSGFYRSSYFDKDTNSSEFIATTQFEATYARRALPCFDEPALKAKFQIHLGRTKDRSSISNMPVEHEGVPMADNDEYVWDQYQESVRMSTYLLAFVVSRFTYRQSFPRPNGVLFRIWSRNSTFDQTDYASDIGPRVLEFYENYFNISFPLPKQDMIAIPDFSAGAMENWGLITYREVTLLYEPGKSSLGDREYVATVVAHELAHQWFGDLVTMEWWTDLWLNEGFASYMEYFGAAHVEPDTSLLDRFPLESMYGTFKQDALQTSHPISVPVNHPDEINEIFDSISYGKGASVIRMMANFLGLDTFIAGVTNYLNLHKYGNAKQDDLWRALTRAAHLSRGLAPTQTVKDIMDTWTLQMGYPVVTANRSYQSRDDAEEQVTLTQERFLLTEDKSLMDNHDYKWWIPISHTTSGGNFQNTKNSAWMSPEQANVLMAFSNLNKDAPLIINVQQTGFYRVNYDKRNWEMISHALVTDHLQIHRINRGQILDDSLNLARAGRLDYSVALGMTEYLCNERDYIPWSAAISGFNYLESMLSRTGGFGEYRKYLISELLPIYDLLGLHTKPGDSFTDILLRETVVKTICKLSYKACTQQSQTLFSSLMAEEGSSGSLTIPNNLMKTIYCSAISAGGEKEWDFLWNMYLKSNNANEKSNILRALACSKEVWILQRYLDMAVDPLSGVRKQDGSSVISSIAGNSVGRYLVWNWIRTKWSVVSTYFDTAISSSVGKMVTACAKTFNTDLELQELQQFYHDHYPELGTAKRGVEIAIQNTKANIQWMQNHYETINTWLKGASKKTKKF